jgi:Type 9 secretion system plug protein 1st domain
MNFRLTFFFFLLFVSTLTFSQVEEVNPPDYIKTITFKSNTNESQLPILKLNERLQLEFDVLNGDEDDYYYKIEYFNFDWTPNRTLLKSEYLQGIDNVRIVNYENSFNTYQIYSHYNLQIPNSQTRLKISGNYLLKIYNDYDELVFTRKFMIYEDLVNVGVAIKRSRDVRFVQQKQSVDFIISSAAMLFNNPKRTVKTVVIQNNNLNTVISNLKPLYSIGRELIYKYDTESSFWGGNEFLYFENKDVRGANVGIQFIDLQDIYHQYLFTDIIRANRPYTYNPDINGNFLITALNARDVAVEADYTTLHFSLQYPEITDDKSIHVYGNFNNYAITKNTKMTFNTRSGNYETTLTLKQGFYNYKYVIVDSIGNIDDGGISGNFWQTENNYKVLVYYRDLGARFDKIIGYGEGNSTNISN